MDEFEKFIPILIDIYRSLSDDGKFRFLACAGEMRDKYQKPTYSQSGKVIQFPTERIRKAPTL